MQQLALSYSFSKSCDLLYHSGKSCASVRLALLKFLQCAPLCTKLFALSQATSLTSTLNFPATIESLATQLNDAMSQPKRLLGVFIPAKRALPANAQPNERAVPIVLPPPLTKERRAELDYSELESYNALTNDELKAPMWGQGIRLRGGLKREH